MRNRTTILVLAIVLSTQLIYLSYLNDTVIEIPERAKGMRIVLDIEHIRDGKVIDTRHKEGDIILQNFVYLMLNAWSGTDASDTWTLKDIDGTNRNWVGNYGLDDNGRIYIGTGTTAPSLAQYEIETIYQTFDACRSDDCMIYSESDPDMNITLVGYFYCQSAASITEVVLATYWEVATGTHKIVALSRDTFSAISVVDGDCLAIYHKWIIDQ